MTLRLRTLGCVALERDGIRLAGRATQRRRLALLLLLAAGRDRGVSRDKLLAYLWPELDAEHGRASLSQTVYWLRRELGNESIVGGIDDLSLSAAALTTDLAEFEDAIAAENLDRAVELYGGPFGEGLFIGGAPEFEHWLDQERHRLAVAWANAVEGLARQAANRGDHSRAAGHWRTLVAADPLNSRLALSLMTAMEAAGERAAAIRHAEAHSALLRSELDIEPDPAVVAFVERLRATDSKAGVAALPPELPPPQTILPAPDAAPRGPAPFRTRPGIRPAVFLGLLLVSAAAGVMWRNGASRQGGTEGAMRIAVLPFSVHGETQASFLREAMVDLLAANLNGIGDYRTVEPRAVLDLLSKTQASAGSQAGTAVGERFGATHFVIGDIVAAGDRLRMHAALYRTGAPEVALVEARSEGPAAELFRLTDEISGQLLSLTGRRPAFRASALAAATTKSLPALRTYLEGERELRGNAGPRAADLFHQATVEDTTFGWAYYRLAETLMQWPSDWGSKYQAAARAAQFSTGLPRAERLLFIGLSHLIAGAAASAEDEFRMLVAEDPDNVEGWFGLGYTLYLYNYVRGRSTQDAREPFERALALDPEHSGALNGLATLALLARDYPRWSALDQRLSALNRRYSVDSLEEADLANRVTGAFVRGDAAARRRIYDELRRTPENSLYMAHRTLSIYTDSLEAAEWVARWIADSGHQPHARAWARRELAHHALHRGKWREAKRALEAVTPGWAFSSRVREALWSLFPFVPASPSELRSSREALRNTALPPMNFAATSIAATHYPALDVPFALDSSRAVTALYVMALIDARLGDSAAAARAVRALEAVPGPPVVAKLAKDLALGVRAEAARAEGRPGEALEWLEKISPEFPNDALANSPFFSEDYSRYLRAELLFELGRNEEALAWYGSHVEVYEQGRLFEAHSHYRRGQIYERMGNRAQAARHYRAFVTIWKDCDPELRPMVADAEQRLQVLGQ
jgi:DNA-binding SARP family transcriptional activator/Flp pilus assembly protein TadD/TolB-like protein